MSYSRKLASDGSQLVHVIQGEYKVSSDPGVVLTTILGSCVATCMSDPKAGVGGINHFLLPQGNGGDGMGYRYGLLSMELLINGLLKMGARKSRLEAKLFGGAAMNDNLSRIGEANSVFALEFLEAEGIPCLSRSLGGSNARRIRYYPTTGAAQQKIVTDHVEPVTAAPVKQPDMSDDVTLF